MSGTAQIKLVVLLDSELRDLARAYADIKATTLDTDPILIEERFKQLVRIGMATLAHLIADPDAPFIILGSRGLDK